jgi:hypothetical protein
MAEQPKALWLAEYLENCKPEDAPVFATATELRRLHEVNAELVLLLKRYRTQIPLGNQPHMIAAEVDAAITKATGELA